MDFNFRERYDHKPNIHKLRGLGAASIAPAFPQAWRSLHLACVSMALATFLDSAMTITLRRR